jgi:Fur family transcriptional regulator, ferric uptake regulator
MTSPSAASPLEAPSAEAAAVALRTSGLRLTTARRLLLDALYEVEEPLSAEELAERVGSGADVASVYRNLEAFEKLGLIRHLHLGHGPGLYARTSLGAREYLVCEACGGHLAVEPGALDEVRETVRRRFGYEARFTHFPIAGLCPDCARAREES